MVWAFFSVQAVIGQRSWWWLLLGPALVVGFGVAQEVGWEARQELANMPVVKLGANLVSLLRGGMALLAMVYLAQSIHAASHKDIGLMPLQALWSILLGG